jgi:hypothetical protein
VSATVSADVFCIPNSEIKKMKYRDCLNELLNESPVVNFEEHINFLYPRHTDYELLLNVEDQLDYMIRDPLEIQTVQTLTTHKIYTKLTQPVGELLTYLWESREIPEHLHTKVQRDLGIIQTYYPAIKTTLDETKNQFSGSDEDKTKAILLLILKLYSLKDRSFKGVIYGYTTNDILKTYTVLYERNISNGMTGAISHSKVITTKNRSLEVVYFAHNHTILSAFAESKIAQTPWERVTDEDLAFLFQDPSIARSIKKKIFMCAITQGFIRNVEDWSALVGVILHHWHRKQVLGNDGRYHGAFDLTLYMGRHQLNCRYNHITDSYRLTIFNQEDPELLKLFVDELTSILECKSDHIIQRSGKGPWMIIDNKVLSTIGDGFAIHKTEIPNPVELTNCQLEINEDWCRLISEGRRIFNTETGLLSCNYQTPPEYDFRVFGLKLSKMCEIGAFSQNFSPVYCSKRTLLDCLEDLKVPMPKISTITKKRIPFTKTWDDKLGNESYETEMIVEDTTMFYQELLDQRYTVDDYKQFVEPMLQEDKFDDLINFMLDTDVIYSMKTSQRLQQTRKIFFLIKNLKYDLIAFCITPTMKLSHRMIIRVKGMYHTEESKYIVFSLVSLYDRVFPNEAIKSPESIKIEIDANFEAKFLLVEDDE